MTSHKPVFRWDDPLLIDECLTEEERMIQDSVTIPDKAARFRGDGWASRL